MTRYASLRLAAAAGLCAIGGGLAVAGFSAARTQAVLLAQAAPHTPVPASQGGRGGDPRDQQPIFRGGANFVFVDVYPRRDGKVVEGLTANDFQVTEDGKPQKVELFEFIPVPPNTPDAERRDPNSKAEGDRLAADPRNRVFVVYLDLFHVDVSGSFAAKRPIIDFLTRTISSTDLFGVMTPEVPVSQMAFVRRTDALEAELAKHWTWGQADRLSVMSRTDAERRLDMCTRADAQNLGALLITLYREDLQMSNLENLMVRLRDLKDERKNVLFISEGWKPQGQHPEIMKYARGNLPTVGLSPGGTLGMGNTQPGDRDTAWCDAQLGRLGSLDNEQRFRALLETARRANVTFYPVDVGGLSTSSDHSRRDTLRTLADNTDGLTVIDTNDIGAGVRRISESLSGYYLLGYYSTNANNDGKFREIGIKTSQPRVSLSARRGYLAATAAMMAAAAAPPVLVSAAVEEELGRLGRVRPDAEVFGYGTMAPGQLDLVVELSSRESESGRWRAGGEVRAVISSAGGGGDISFAGKLEPGARATVLHVPVPPDRKGPWKVSLRVTGSDGFVEDHADVPVPAGTLLGQPAVYRAAPSPRAVLKPMADFLLRRTERLRAEWPVLTPLTSREVRILDRRGQPLGLAAAAVSDKVDGGPAVAVDLAIAPFAEGDYVLELTAKAGADSERKLLAFRVVR